MGLFDDFGPDVGKVHPYLNIWWFPEHSASFGEVTGSLNKDGAGINPRCQLLWLAWQRAQQALDDWTPGSNVSQAELVDAVIKAEDAYMNANCDKAQRQPGPDIGDPPLYGFEGLEG